jgi:hypothetical protein
VKSSDEKIVRVKVSGGLGNQLFMYVAGLSVAQRCGARLEVYRKPMDKAENLHPGDLSQFQIPLLANVEAVLSDGEKILPRLQRLFTRRCHKISTPFIKYFNYFESSDIGYDSRLHLLSQGVEIRGYFQTYKYFDEIKHQLGTNQLVSLQNPSSYFNSCSLIFNRNKVCAIHVRRGDYQLHQESIGLIGLAYYKNAIQIVKENRIVELFVVFSDDSEAAYALLGDSLPSDTIWPKDLESLSPAENIVLMSRADSLVIANSSFSLFAGLLAREESLIIRPSSWYTGQNDPIDLFSPHWIEVAIK